MARMAKLRPEGGIIVAKKASQARTFRSLDRTTGVAGLSDVHHRRTKMPAIAKPCGRERLPIGIEGRSARRCKSPSLGFFKQKSRVPRMRGFSLLGLFQ
jgi:hypothetical protein